MTCVVNCKVKYLRPLHDNLKEWCKDENNIYIGRGGVVFVKNGDNKERYPKKDSILCNPFKIDTKNNRQDVINKFREYMKEKIKNKDEKFLNELDKCKNKNLGCWCVEEKQCNIELNNKMICHGEVIMKYLKTGLI